LKGKGAPPPKPVVPAAAVVAVAESVGENAVSSATTVPQHATVMAALQQILNNQKRSEAATLAALDKLRASFATELASSEKRTLVGLSSRIDRLETNFAKSTQQLAAKVESSTAGMDARIASALNSALPSIMAASAPATAAATVAALRPELLATTKMAVETAVAERVSLAVRDQFERSLIPAVEAAVAQAATQIRAAVDKGAAAAEFAAANGASGAVASQLAVQLGALAAPVAELVSKQLNTQLNAALKAAVGPAVDAAMGRALGQIVAEMGVIRAEIRKSAERANGYGTMAAQAPAVDPRIAIIAEVEALRQSGYIEKAFATALSTADREVVESLMANVQPQALIHATDHSASTVSSKQIVLISLLQQLGTHLVIPPSAASMAALAATSTGTEGNWPELHIRYLSDCLLALEPSEPVISASVSSVLAVVEQSLVSLMAMPPPREAQRPLSICLHVVRSLQR